MSDRRTHSKIDAIDDPELRGWVDEALNTPGVTYDDIAATLKRAGYDIGKSSVHRYNRNLLRKLLRVKAAREKAKVIVDQMGDQPSTAMAEAATEILLTELTELLCNLPDAASADMNLAEIAKAVNQLTRAKTNLEAEKRRYADRAAKIEEEMKGLAKEKGLDDADQAEMVARIRKVYGA